MPGSSANVDPANADCAPWSAVEEALGTVGNAIDHSLSAFDDTTEKVMSVTTKKRMTARALQGLRSGKELVKELSFNLQHLYKASQTWERHVQYASKSQRDLMDHLDHVTCELDDNTARLHLVEGEKRAMLQERQDLLQQLQKCESELQAWQATLKEREDELEAGRRVAAELRAELAQRDEAAKSAAAAAADAEDRAAAAVAALDEARQDGAKAHEQAARHQEVLARLAADNVLFVAQLKAADEGLRTLASEKEQLALAVQQQRGPWFDEVRQGMEAQVREAFRTARDLQQQLEREAAAHTAALQALQQEKAELEEYLSRSASSEQDMRQRMEAAQTGEESARAAAAAAQLDAGDARRRADEAEAQLGALQRTLRGMREECNERWAAEQAARAEASAARAELTAQGSDMAALHERVAALKQELDMTQHVNVQLMARRNEVEWRLMEAQAQLDARGGVHPEPAASHPTSTPTVQAAPCMPPDRALAPFSHPAAYVGHARAIEGVTPAYHNAVLLSRNEAQHCSDSSREAEREAPPQVDISAMMEATLAIGVQGAALTREGLAELDALTTPLRVDGVPVGPELATGMQAMNDAGDLHALSAATTAATSAIEAWAAQAAAAIVSSAPSSTPSDSLASPRPLSFKAGSRRHHASLNWTLAPGPASLASPSPVAVAVRGTAPVSITTAPPLISPKQSQTATATSGPRPVAEGVQDAAGSAAASSFVPARYSPSPPLILKPAIRNWSRDSFCESVIGGSASSQSSTLSDAVPAGYGAGTGPGTGPGAVMPSPRTGSERSSTPKTVRFSDLEDDDEEDDERGGNDRGQKHGGRSGTCNGAHGHARLRHEGDGHSHGFSLAKLAGHAHGPHMAHLAHIAHVAQGSMSSASSRGAAGMGSHHRLRSSPRTTPSRPVAHISALHPAMRAPLPVPAAAPSTQQPAWVASQEHAPGAQS